MPAWPGPASSESPAASVCRWLSECRFAVTAEDDSPAPLATLPPSVSSGVCPRVRCRRQEFFCRRSQLLGARQEVCRLPSGLADVAGPLPCSICLPAPPSRYGLGVGEPAFDGLPIEGFPRRALVQGCTSLRRHLLTLLGRLAKFSRDGRPGGSQPAFAPSVATRIQAITAWLSLAPPSSYPHRHRSPLRRGYPCGSDTGLPCSACVTGLE